MTMARVMVLPVRVAASHPRTVSALAVVLIAYVGLPITAASLTRAIIAWDIGAIVLLGLTAWMFATEGNDAAIARNARRQQEGEWTVFAVTIAGVAFSFAALGTELATTKGLSASIRTLHTILVATTLFVSWLVMHVVFALRYAHEYYAGKTAPGDVDGGLNFPGTEPPDYWDFIYFALVLGMTFQVSDVVITSRKLRRLATLHGLLAFLFNTVIVALTVNIAAGLL